MRLKLGCERVFFGLLMNGDLMNEYGDDADRKFSDRGNEWVIRRSVAR